MKINKGLWKNLFRKKTSKQVSSPEEVEKDWIKTNYFVAGAAGVLLLGINYVPIQGVYYYNVYLVQTLPDVLPDDESSSIEEGKMMFKHKYSTCFFLIIH